MQACYYEKAKASNMKPSILAKLAHQAADLFRSAREDLKVRCLGRCSLTITLKGPPTLTPPCSF